MTLPALCAHHEDAIARMAEHGHVDTEATEEAAREMERQCCRWRKEENR